MQIRSMIQRFIIYTQDSVWEYTLLTTYSVIRGSSMSQLLLQIEIDLYIRLHTFLILSWDLFFMHFVQNKIKKTFSLYV